MLGISVLRIAYIICRVGPKIVALAMIAHEVDYSHQVSVAVVYSMLNSGKPVPLQRQD